MKKISVSSVGFFALILFAGSTFAQVKQAVLSSPDRQVRLNLTLKKEHLLYTLSYKGRPVITSSSMGLETDAGIAGQASVLQLTNKKTINETYPWRGVHNKAVYHANTAQIVL
ncbi:MAG TPA: glycoside hydrolase family 97 N-terminal domain-containing protein, partial [Pedobacter sp.]